jgi:glucosyl-3-phosphoglycerate synthase
MQSWYERRTFSHQQFKSLKELLALKHAGGHRISVCLPTFNEHGTIKAILDILRQKLMEQTPLVDELAVMDGGSTDGTVEIAAACGAKVYDQRKVLRQYRNSGGKGEALWKSLHVLRGDIIVWLDSDIKNMHPRFVYGLVGPLLTDPDIGYVKGYYQRPLRSGSRTYKAGGGRVTELVARPLLNLFYPDLACLIQPLSGEYAGRRAVLESIPFFTGYGVEIGMLIDIYNRFGLEAIAQVDLVERVHRNQGLPALSKMSFEVMQAMLLRLAEDERLEVFGDLSRVFHSINYRDGAYGIDRQTVKVVEKPPMRQVRREAGERSGRARARD